MSELSAKEIYTLAKVVSFSAMENARPALNVSSTRCLMLNLSAFRWSTDEEFFGLVTEYFTPQYYSQEQYVRTDGHCSTLCSPWLETVPLLLDTSKSTPLLSVSLRTLGYSIITKENRDRRSNQWDLCRAQSYTKAVRSLKNKITEDDGGCNESAAAIMCLCLAEWLVPTSREGWIAHIRGIGRMMEMCGPESFARPVSHQLFIGFRPLVILEACISRQDTFLSSHEWRTIPFALLEPSPLQTLLSHGSILPSILQRVQSIDSLPLKDRRSECQSILADLINTLQELDIWEQSLQAAINGPLCWPITTCSSPARANSAVEGSLWFYSLPIATSLTHLWAFRAVCFSQIAHLLSSDPTLRTEAMRTCLNVSEMEDCRQQTFAFHRMVCQSMLYFKQSTLRFYGAAAVTLPLRVTQMALLLLPADS
ncbi:hypothetical protein M747DRAFT_349721 [Aspergillus niger ATCC 13496]|uniref:C6 transcription factor n=2 Tax=Aspergillus niger TaxID=5061 RepID=A0A370C4W5_ASPNG|nr:hypothetical protein ANI_1_2090094 [Aspergillus niger CBS 513.88]RDH21190.1 hypothetical protein M747DRAFT_349721 [Aspergillus niger ATCC 13496]|eukprot:XP_001394575.2 hypothetical protein ANI_1_2090094 [Aspergillus niger CBS 513.88]